MYSVGYHFVDIADGQAFLKEIKEAGVVNDEELKMIAYENVEGLLGLHMGADVTRSRL